MSDQARLPQASGFTRGECRLADKVGWLRSRQAAGDEAIETHFAWVFLTGDRAWKLRKPVRRDSMDYGTLEARRRDSEAEVRLNRRLAPHVYLGTQPLTIETDGRLAIGGDGMVVDWLVEMRRLDRSRMLDVRLARGAVSEGDLAGAAAQLAAFYAAEPPAVSDGAQLAARLRAQVEANRDALEGFDPEAARALSDAQLAFVESRGDWLHARAAGGCVVEAHGDLFLALECARLGHAAAGERIARDCLGRLGDAAPPALRNFYRSHRASTRAKLYVWRAGEPDGGTPQQWHAIAREYLAHARQAVGESAATTR